MACELIDCRITNAVKCLPPAEQAARLTKWRICNAWLRRTLPRLPAGAAVLALGRIAHDAALRALRTANGRRTHSRTAAATLCRVPRLFDSYHCSRYNTNTRRLTTEMFRPGVRRVSRVFLGAARRAMTKASTP